MNERELGASEITSVTWVHEGYEDFGVEWPVSGDKTALTEYNFFVPRK